MNKTLIKNGRIIDPASNRDETADILVADEDIAEIGHIEPDNETNVIDATGKIVTPGIIDLHVHLRDMGQVHKETIESGTKAARKGGVTTVFTMPNTQPVLDSVQNIQKYLDVIKGNARVDVHVVGAITSDLNDKELAEIDSYSQLGIHFITDDGTDVNNEELLKIAYQKAKELDLIVMTHPEIDSIAPDGAINEGAISKQLNIPGQPNEKEYKAIERAIRISQETGARAHLTHISTKESVDLIRQAKKTSDKITCDVAVHHICLTEEKVLECGSQAKVNPPLRTEMDRMALIEGIKDGTIDAIVTDHAPHAENEKTDNVKTAAFGFSGLEILVPASITELYFKQKIDLETIIRLMTINPANLTNLRVGRLQPGYPADITIIDLENEKTVDRHQFISKGKNTPFHGTMLKGWPEITIVKGEIY